MGEFLKVDDITVTYKNIVAVNHVSFEVREGGFVAIIGRNGAGKTSVVKSLFGLVPIRSGNIQFQGRQIIKFPPHTRANMRMALVVEGRGVFPEMSVLENLEMGAYIMHDKKAISLAMEETFHYFPVLSERRRQKAGTLSGGEQQMMVIGRALMCQPSLLVMDEPSLGLAPVIINILEQILAQIHQGGKSILLAEQNASLALRSSKECIILENGSVAQRGNTQVLSQDRSLKEAFLGG